MSLTSIPPSACLYFVQIYEAFFDISNRIVYIQLNMLNIRTYMSLFCYLRPITGV